MCTVAVWGNNVWWWWWWWFVPSEIGEGGRGSEGNTSRRRHCVLLRQAHQGWRCWYDSNRVCDQRALSSPLCLVSMSGSVSDSVCLFRVLDMCLRLHSCVCTHVRACVCFFGQEKVNPAPTRLRDCWRQRRAIAVLDRTVALSHRSTTSNAPPSLTARSSWMRRISTEAHGPVIDAGGRALCREPFPSISTST